MHTSKFRQIFRTAYMLPMALARSSSGGNATRYVLPVLWTTLYFHMMERMGQNQRRVISSLPRDGNGSEVCRIRLHLFDLRFSSFSMV